MIHQRSIRRIALTASTALASGLFVVAAPAFAQLGPLPDVDHLTTTTAGLSGGAPGSTNPIVSTTGADGAQTMQIDLRDNRSILTWRGAGFNIADGNTVNFKDARSSNGVTGRTDNIAVLNRDLSDSRSYIGGTLKSDSNVAVYVINQQGIMFGAGGSVDTGSFFASASDLSNDTDFLNGSNTLRFSRYLGGDVGTDPGTQFKTTASSSSDGGRMGDFVLIGSRIFFNGFDGSYTTGDIGGDAGLIVASDVTVISAPGSPLSFLVHKGSIEESHVNSNLTIGGKLTARNITVALTSTGSAVRDPARTQPTIDLTGSLIATGAAVTDRGVVLTSGASAPGVSIAGIRSATTTADIFAGGHVRQTETGVIKSASDAWVAADTHIMYGSLEADGAVGIDATLTWFGALASPYGTITGGSVTLNSDALFLGKITATNGDITANVAGKSLSFSDLQASGGIKLTSTTLDITEGGLLAGGAIDINTTGAVNILDTGSAGSGIAQGASVSVISGSDIRIGKIVGTTGNVTLDARNSAVIDTLLSGNDASVDGAEVRLTDAAVDGDLVISSSGGSVFLGAESGGGLVTGTNVSVIANSVTGQATLTGASVQIRGFSEVSYAGMITSTAGDINISGINQYLTGGLDAARDISISGSHVVNQGATRAGRDVSANTSYFQSWNGITAAGSISLIDTGTDGISVGPGGIGVSGNFSAGGNIYARTARGFIELPALSAGGNVHLEAGDVLTLPGNIVAGGDLFAAGTSVDLGAFGSPVTLKAKGALTIKSLDGYFGERGPLTLQSNSDGVGSEALTLESAVGISAPSTWTLLGGTARQSDIQIRTSGDAAISLGTLTGRGLLGAVGNAGYTTGVSTSSDITVIGAINLTDTLKLTGSNVSTANVTAGNINIISSQRAEGTTLTAAGTIDVRAPNLILFSDLIAPGGITLTASGVPQQDSGYVVIGSAKALGDEADVNISASRSVTSLGSSAPVQAGRDVLIRGGLPNSLSWGELGVNLGSIKAGRNLAITGAGISTTTLNATTGSVSMIGTGGSLKALSVVAGGSITGNGTSVRIGQAVAQNAEVTLTANGGNLDIGDMGLASLAGGNMTLTANGGATTIRGSLTSLGDMSVTGNGVNIWAQPGKIINIRARGAVTIDGRTDDISAFSNGGLIQSNSDGIGEEALTLQTSGGIGMVGTDLLGGTLRQSDVRLRYGAAQFIQLTGVSARGLLGASNSAPFVNGLNTTSNILIAGKIDLVNSLSLAAPQIGVKSINVRNGDVTIRTTWEHLELSAPIVASGDVFLETGSRGLLIDGGGTVSGRNVVISTAGEFTNLRGPDAITASGHWVIYSRDPSGAPTDPAPVDFGGLDSSATALWGATYATRAPSTIAGNRYVFAVQPTLTFSTADLTKIYGTDLTGSASLPFGVTGYHPGVAGAFLADTATTAYAGTPSITSSGFAARATVAGGPYTTSIARGSLTSDAGYAFTFSNPGMVTITPKALTGTVAIDTKSYDGTTAATGTVGLTGVVTGDSVGTTGSVFAFLDKNAAAGKTVTVTGTALNGVDSGNYTLTMPASALGDILKKALTANVTVDAKTYDGTTAATGTLGISGVLTGETVGTTGSTFTFADKNAGTGKTVIVSGTSLTGADAGNYALTLPANVVADILQKALSGTIAVDTKTYDGTTTGSGIVNLSGVVSGDQVGTTGSSFTFADKNAGAGKTVTVTGTTLNGSDAGNYTLTLPATALGNILQKALAGTITVNGKTYDGTTAATGSVGLVGAISGDSVGTTGSVFTFADKNAGTGKTVTISGTALNGADAGNYTLALPATALADILQKALTGSITVSNKTYDGTTVATGSVGLSGAVSGDSVGTTGSTFTFADKNAGIGKTVTVSGTTLNGADAGNYTLTLPASALGDILQKALAGNIVVNSKTYDGTTAATGSVGLSGTIAGDSVGTTGSVFTFADKNAGMGKTVTVSGTTLNGTDAGNYTLTLPATALGDILQKALAGTVTVNGKTYDGSTAATGSIGLSGAISGDSVGTTGSVFTFADKNAGTGRTVTVSGTMLNGTDAGNYTLTLPATALADILQKAITGSVTVSNKTYDGTTAATGSVALSGTISGDNVGTTGSVFTFADKNAGTGKTVTLTGTALNGADAGNYTLSVPANALADILKKTLSGAITVNGKTYDGTTAATGSVSLSGVVAGETVGTTGSTFAFADKNAGTGKTVTVSGTALNGADAGNYTLSIPATALADILKKALTGSITVSNKTYDGTTAASGSLALSGVLAGDSVGTSGSVFAFADKNAGTGKAVTVSGTTLNGADGGNYTLTLPASALADILKRALTVQADDLAKREGATDPALTFTVTNGSLVAGDALAGALVRGPGEAVGDYAITQGSLSGGQNYELTFRDGVFTITERPASETQVQPLRSVVLPGQLPDLTPSSAPVELDDGAVCGEDPACVTSN